LFRFSTRSDYDKLQRAIQAKKFYATLPHKLDRAEEKWLKAQPDEPELDWKFEEAGEFGQDGWTISYTHKSVENNDV
jgi:hypothetical protein